MKHSSYFDFGKLYREAYAERNPARQMELLSLVQRAIEHWEEGGQSAASLPPRFALPSMSDSRTAA